MALGRLLRYLQLVTSLRIQDISIRKQDREERRAEIAAKILERDAREEKRNTDKAQYIRDLEQGIDYNEEDFQAWWIKDNPEIEIPEEVQDEDDFDLETEKAEN